jgi:anti-sigma regulatory factor (Ser/Thr protein kinase)
MDMQITLDAKLEAVSKSTQQLEIHLQQLALELRTTIVLAVQELLVNIVQHAYDGKQGTIEFAMQQAKDSINIQVRDYAPKAFEKPDQLKAPDPLDLPEHGMGLYIIYQTFDEVAYQRLADGNHWRLVKAL